MAARRMSSTGKIEDEEEEGRRKSDKEMTGERKKEAYRRVQMIII